MKQSKYILDKCPLDYLGKIHNQLRVKNDLIDYLSRVCLHLWNFLLQLRVDSKDESCRENTISVSADTNQ